jgi:hypothetical protein
MTFRERFSIGDDKGFSQERYDWVKQTFKRTDYLIVNTGFIYDSYSIEFLDPAHATLYRLKWS